MIDPVALAGLDGKLKFLRQLLQDPTIPREQAEQLLEKIIKELETIHQTEIAPYIK